MMTRTGRQSVSRFGRQPVADILKERGISRVEMARRLKVSLGIFNNTLAGHQTPSDEIRQGLSDMLRLRVEELFTAEPLARRQGKRYRQGTLVTAGDDTKIRRLTPEEREDRDHGRQEETQRAG